MYSSSDFESFFLRYKAEAVLQVESVQSFCSRNSVPYNLFQKWYKDTCHRVAPVQVEGCPNTESDQPPVNSSPDISKDRTLEPLRILVDIRMSNGLHVQQRNLSYPEFKQLVENLEVLC